MAECGVCKGGSPDWMVTCNGESKYACKDHISKVLSGIGKGVTIMVRGLVT